ncbi:MAG TPA: DinB family protein [Dehalococcoidia bacterium]|nr:DinB family protein [Dehalococcoidia bacterium]
MNEPNPSLYVLDRPLTRAQVLEELAAFPARLRDKVAGLPAESLLRGPGGEEWSAFQTLLHLRDATLVYAIRFRFIVFNNDPFLPDYDEGRWVARSKDSPADVDAILDEIASSRAGLLRVLARLPEEDWMRTGRHEVMGPVMLEHYARHQVVHEEMHLAQIEAALGASA